MNHDYRARPPVPGPACESFAPLLPLVGQQRFDSRDSSQLRQHLATCDYCQSELASYNWLDDALARHFGPVPRGPLAPADIREITSRAYRPRTAPPEPAHAPEPGGNRQRPELPRLPTRPQPLRRGRRLLSILSAAAAVLIIAAVGLALFVSGNHVFTGNPKTPTPAIPIATLPVYVPNDQDRFNSLSMVSPTEGWIVGNNISNTSPRPLILHYLNGQALEVNNLTLQGVNIDTAVLTQIGMLSTTEGWAAGPYGVTSGCTSTLFLRYTGGRWKQGSTPSGTNLISIALTSPTNGWAVATYDLACHQEEVKPPILYHYDGTQWTPASVPSNTVSLEAVVMTSANNGWAIGQKPGNGIEPDPGLLLHYDGKTWTEVNVPGVNQLGKVLFQQIAMASATDGWLVGSIFPGTATANIAPYAAGPLKSVLFHYDGNQWSEVNTVLDTIQRGIIYSLSLAPDGSGWLVGSLFASGTPFFLRLSNGIWSQAHLPKGASPSQIFPLSADDAWAIGEHSPFLHYHNGAWETISLGPSSTPTAAPTSTAGTSACTSHSGPAGAPGATVTPVPFASWGSYTNTAYHFRLKYPTNWVLDNLNCPESAYLAFWNYNYLNWQGPGFPSGGIKIELYALDNPNGLSAMQFFQDEQQNQPGGPSCPAYTTRALQVGGHDAIEVTCPGQTLDLYYIPDGASMLRIAQGTGANASSDVLAEIVNSLTFTS